ncbi:MAG: hypothetical protein ACP5PP_08355 [Fervidobacterium sp.]
MERMEKILTLVILLLFISPLHAFKLDFSLTGYLTYGLNDSSYDNFPIAYWTITPPQLLDMVSIKLTDYLTYTHGNVDFNGFIFPLPRYYFLDSTFNFGDGSLYLSIGRQRLSRNLTSKFESVRLGGFKFDTYNTSVQAPPTIGGITGYWSGKIGLQTYEIGGSYSLDLQKYAVYGTVSSNFGQFGNGRLGIYYESKYENASINYSHQVKTDFGQFDIWTGFAAAQSNLLEPSFILGTTWKQNPFTISSQFVYIGANKYDVEFATGEPSNPNMPYSWNFMFEAGCENSGIYNAVFVKYNSKWLESGWLPLYGFKFKIADLTISFANGDLSSSLLGTQNVLLQLTYNYKASIDLVQIANSTLQMIQPIQSQTQLITTPQSTKTTRISELYTMPEGSKVTVTGVILSPVGLLSSATTYIQDESGAIMLYGKSIPTTLQVGDLVSVSGTTKMYNGVLEILVDNISKVGSKQPKPVEVKKVETSHLSNLVSVQGVVKSISKDTIILDTGESDVKVYVKSATDINLSNISQGDTVSIVGIVSLFKNELEVLPRSQEDIRMGN